MTVRPIYLALAGAVGLLALSGCALNERIGRPDTALPPRFEAPQSTSAAPLSSLDQWWIAFNDPQLTTLVSQALISAPDARSAYFRLAEARATRNQEIAGVLPKGDIAASAQDQYSRESYSKLSAGIPPQFAAFFTAGNGSTQQYAASWNTSWEIDLYGKDFTAIKAAKAGFAAARFDFEATRLSVAAEVATDLFQARGLAAQLEDAGETERLARSLADTTRRKAEAGLATTADAARTLSDQESAAAQTALVEAQLRGAVRSLLVLIGRGGALASTLPVTAAISPPPELPAVTPGLLLTRRPDIREAEQNLTEAAGVLKLDKLALFPTLTLQPSLQALKQVESIYTIDTRSAAGAVGLSAPVLSLPRLIAQVRIDGARGRQALVTYEKTIQTAYGDAERALTTLEADRRRVLLLTSATERSRFAYDAAQEGYRMGLTDLTSAVQAEQTWRQTRAALTNAEVSVLLDTVTACKALGGGWNAEASRSVRS